jgi:hypothetical protein
VNLSLVEEMNTGRAPCPARREFALIGDVDADGERDVALWTWPSNNDEPLVALIVVDYRGKVLLEVELTESNEYSIADAGDVDADGAPDLLLGDYWGRVQVQSGRTGERLQRFDTDVPGYPIRGSTLSLCGLGDLDEDGHADFAYSIFHPHIGGLPGRVRVHSGKEGTLMWEHTLEAARSLPRKR